MTIMTIEIEMEEISITTSSSINSLSDKSLNRGKSIRAKGKPVYSSTYAFPEIIHLESGGNRLQLPDKFSIRINKSSEESNDVGTLYFIKSYSDEELGIYEDDQFEAVINYPSDEFEDLWNLIGNFCLGEIKMSASINAPKTDISGYETILDIKESTSWPLCNFHVSRVAEILKT